MSSSRPLFIHSLTFPRRWWTRHRQSVHSCWLACVFASITAVAGAEEPSSYATYREAARAIEAQDLELTADLLLRASRAAKRPDWETLLYASTLFAQQGRLDSSREALELSIRAGLRDPDLLAGLPPLEPLRSDEEWPDRLERVRSARQSYLAKIGDPALFEELDSMWRRDQEAHQRWSQPESGREAEEELMRVLHENQTRLESIIEESGWPGFERVGKDGGKLAWGIVQHAQSIAFQRKCLRLIAGAVARSDADPEHYAELHDRIARETWQRQLFGASMAQDAPHPIEDEVRVDQRRAQLGLDEPVDLYAAMHGITYRKPSLEKALERRAASHTASRQLYRELQAGIDQGDADLSRKLFIRASALHGDYSSLELFNLAVDLADSEMKGAKILSLRLLRVVIGRQWSNRHAIPGDDRLSRLHDEEGWKALIEELGRPDA